MKGTKKSIWELNYYVPTLTEVFLNQKRINVCKHTVNMAPSDRGGTGRREEWRENPYFSTSFPHGLLLSKIIVKNNFYVVLKS